jgi:hypothetical protein
MESLALPPKQGGSCLVNTNGDIQEIAKRILNILSSGNQRLEPKDLIPELTPHGFSEDRIRAVVWALIDRDELILRNDWTLAKSSSDAASVARLHSKP